MLSGFLQTQWVSLPMLSQVFGVPSLLKFFGSSAALSPQVFFSSGNLPVPRSSRTSTHSAPRSCPNLGMLVAVSTYVFPYHTSHFPFRYIRQEEREAPVCQMDIVIHFPPSLMVLLQKVALWQNRAVLGGSDSSLPGTSLCSFCQGTWGHCSEARRPPGRNCKQATQQK